MWDIPDCLVLADRLDRIDRLRRLLRALATELSAAHEISRSTNNATP